MNDPSLSTVKAFRFKSLKLNIFDTYFYLIINHLRTLNTTKNKCIIVPHYNLDLERTNGIVPAAFQNILGSTFIMNHSKF